MSSCRSTELEVLSKPHLYLDLRAMQLCVHRRKTAQEKVSECGGAASSTGEEKPIVLTSHRKGVIAPDDSDLLALGYQEESICLWGTHKRRHRKRGDESKEKMWGLAWSTSQLCLRPHLLSPSCLLSSSLYSPCLTLHSSEP